MPWNHASRIVLRQTCRILCVLLMFGGTGLGQGGAWAQLSGVVTDQAGDVVKGATVTLRSVETGLARTAVASDSGQYMLANIPPGFYELSVEAPGFARAHRPQFELTVGQQASLNPVLQVEGLAQEVTISASEGLVLEPTRTEQSQVIEEKRIQTLPINGRQFLDFALLTPNVDTGRSNIGNASTPGEPSQIDISFAGLHETTSLITVDGADNINRIFGRSRATPSQEAVREFRVLTNSYGADIGPATGAVVSIITKSGANELFGSGYYFFRNDALDARNPLAPVGFDELSQHQYGVSVGGPLVRDRWFLFGNYEAQRREESPFYSTVLLDNLAAINAVKVGLGLPPEVLAGRFREMNYESATLRTDLHLTPEHQLGIVYRFRNEDDLNMGGATGQLSAPSNFRNGFIEDHALVANLTSALTQRLVNQFHFQFADRDFVFDAVSFEPHLQIANTLDMGRHFNAIDGSAERRIDVANTITYTRGAHTLRAGGSIYHTRDRFFYNPFDPAFVIFPNLNAFLGRPPFPPFPFAVVFGYSLAPDGTRPPAPPDFSSSANLPAYESLVRIEGSQTHYALFAQDQWRPTRNLTLNFGLRWDVDDLPEQYYETYYKAVQPRVGVAYSTLSDRLVFRAGAGYFQGVRYTLGYLDQLVSGQDPAFGIARPGEDYSLSPGTLRGAFISNPSVATPAFLTFLATGRYPATVGPGLLPAQSFFLTNRRDNHGGPYTYQWNAQVDFGLTDEIALSGSYLGVRGYRQISAFGGNVAPALFKLPNGENDYAIAPGVPVARALNPLGSPLSLFFDDEGRSTYHGATFTAMKRFSNHYAFTANYTWSKAMDDSGSPSLNGYPEDPYRRDLERARSKQHVAHRFVGNFTAEAPEDTWLRHFRFAFIGVAASPHYFSVLSGLDVNHDGNATTDRVDTIGRNTYRGDNYVNFDVRISRVFPITEKVRAEAIAEAFNVFNTLNVIEVNMVYGAPGFIGPIPREFGDGAPAPLPSFGTIRAIAPPRQIQFGFRLMF